MSKKIILASSSPRRKELLTLADVVFEIRVPEVDETPKPKEDPKAMVKRLALLKAKTVAEELIRKKQTGIILAADTTVVSLENKNLGKPEDEKEALKMISALQGKKHQVYTAYALVDVRAGRISRKLVRAVLTRVAIRKLSKKEVQAYVAKGESLDKAGAYAAQGYGMAMIEKIEGSYTNVIGLPVSHVLSDLRNFGWKL